MRVSSLNRLLAAVASVATLASAACSPQYEYDRPGTWRATGANEANLRAMVANKRDLVAGASTATDRGNAGARAVTRLLNDRRRPLLSVTTSRLGGGSDSDTGGGAIGAGGAAAGSSAPGSGQ